MIPSALSARRRRAAAAFFTALSLATLPAIAAHAQSASDESVARNFVQAAQSQDRQTALALLDPAVSIEFPVNEPVSGHASAQGPAFVIGYFDGLFDGRRYALDSTAVSQTAEGGEVRFIAHDVASHALYGLDVEVRHQHIVKLKLDVTPARASAPSAPVRDNDTLASAAF